MKKTLTNTIWRWPWEAAKWRLVSSPIFVAFTRAPLTNNISTIEICPSFDAQCKREKAWSSLEIEKLFNHPKPQKYPIFKSCSESSSQTRTWNALPSLTQPNTSSLKLGKLNLSQGLRNLHNNGDIGLVCMIVRGDWHFVLVDPGRRPTPTHSGKPTSSKPNDPEHNRKLRLLKNATQLNKSEMVKKSDWERKRASKANGERARPSHSFLSRLNET